MCVFWIHKIMKEIVDIIKFLLPMDICWTISTFLLHCEQYHSKYALMCPCCQNRTCPKCDKMINIHSCCVIGYLD